MKYDNRDCNRFVSDMAKAGLTTEHYNGRFFWEGPAVRVKSIQDAISSTKVSCQWDQMGLGYIVYPKKSGRQLPAGSAAHEFSLNLNKAFKELRAAGFLAFQNYSCCQSCAGAKLVGFVENATDEARNKFKGVVYYHKQDGDNKKDGKDFYLAYGRIDHSKHGMIGLPTEEIGKTAVEVLNRNGIKTEWNGNAGTRIKVKQKIEAA